LIDFRYYIVTITAIFLALGIGIVTGATVLDRVTVNALRDRLDGLRDQGKTDRANIKTLRGERDAANDLVGALAPRITEGALNGEPVVFVHGEDSAGWEGDVQNAIRRAGAVDTGTIVLTKKWTLDTAAARDDLRSAFADVKLDEKDLKGDAARVLGKMLSDPGAASFVQRLEDAGYLKNAPSNDTDPFPPPTVRVVVFAAPDDSWVTPFAAGAAEKTSTLAVASKPEEAAPIVSLRGASDANPRLATFDSGSDARADVGAVLAFRAAIENKGGNFGRGRGLKYVPAL